MLVYLLIVAIVLIALLLCIGASFLLHLQGGSLVLFVVLTLVLAAVAAGTILYLHLRGKKREGQDGEAVATEATAEIDLLINDANRKLKASKQQGSKSLDELSLLYILGDAGSAKTTLVTRSGLEPELLAGTAPRAGEADVIPTPLLNVWFTRQAGLLELGHGLRANESLLTRLVQRSRPNAYRSAFGSGASPRAAVVCVAAKLLLNGESSLASARATGSQLREISRVLGAALPVYVIVTKLDEIPHFTEYVRNLSNEEVGRVLGTTIKPSEASAGVYADNATRELSSVLDALSYSLGEFRVEILSRETQQGNAPMVYEFPREFTKLRGNLTQYMVELCKPSQLSTNPYLRGFYFCGVRAQVVEQENVADSALAAKPAQNMGATQYLSVASVKQATTRPAKNPVFSSVRVPQWAFLPRLFPDVILNDKTILVASRQTAPAQLFRRTLFAVLGTLCGIYLILLVISFFNNLALEHRITDAARSLPVVSPTATGSPGLGDLQMLDQLRQVILQLDGFHHDGPPWSYRFGLYQGDKLAIQARHVYFDRFRPLLLNTTQANFVTYLKALPDAAGGVAGDDSSSYDNSYKPLRAYLITTTNPTYSTADFLSPIFLQYWVAARTVDPEQQRLVRLQADFYANELARKNPYSIDAETSSVTHARKYLSSFGGTARIYQNMLTAAEKATSSINFNKKYPGSAESVLEPEVVRGAFTRAGFDAMQEAIRNPDRYVRGETWVIGDQGVQTIDKTSLANQLATTYSSDYVKAWQSFLAGGKLVGCGGASPAGLKPTAGLLDRLSRPDSPLLEFFYTISHNTAVNDPNIKKIFKSTQALVDSEAVDAFIGPGNKVYMDAIVPLSVAVGLLAKNAPATMDAAAFTSIGASLQTGLNAVAQTQQTMSVDSLFQTEKKVTALLKAPIECAERLVPAAGAAVNAAGAQMCKLMSPVLLKQPFSPSATAQATVAEVDSVFAPDTGSLWVTYNGVLKPLLAQQGSQYVPAPNPAGSATPAFAAFFSHAARISSALYPAGAKSPAFSFTLRPVASKEIEGATLVMDGQRLPGGASSQQFNWNGASASQASLAYNHGESLRSQGTWSLFQLVHHAKATVPAPGQLRLEFPIEVSGQPMILSDGTPMVVRFDLSGTGVDILGPGGLSGLHCVAPVVK